MRNVYPFIVQKYNNENLKWEYLESFSSLYSAQCCVFAFKSQNDYKYRILEVVDLYV